ncbi:MAG: sigma 54-interacting transcriptional regulator [Desulfovibrionaceae bacterium]
MLPVWGSLRAKLQMTLIPLAVLILLVTGVATYYFSSIFLETAQERTLSVTAYGMAREVESALESARRSVLYAAAGPLDEHSMRDFLKRSTLSGRIPFREIAVISPDPAESIFLVSSGEEVFRIPMPEIPSAEMLFRHGDSNPALRPGDASLSGIEKAEYVLPLGNTKRNKVFTRVVRLVSPAHNKPGSYVMLSIDAASLRNILSQTNSVRSPLWATSPVSEARFCFLFDLSGWILFQSNSPDEPEAPLMTSLARAGMDGTLGKPGHPEAFQPSAGAGAFWNMLAEVQKGRYGVLSDSEGFGTNSSEAARYSLAYWPVTFRTFHDKPPVNYGGLAFIDYSSLSLTAGYKQVDVVFVISLVAIAVFSLAIYLVSRTLTSPLRILARRVILMRDSRKLEPLELQLGDSETQALGVAIDSLIETVRRQMDEIRAKDEAILMASLRERVSLDEMLDDLPPGALNHVIPEIFGSGPSIDTLKSEILKAASVDADVLIEGETGTGKQLTAEAIHRNSSRASGPFISINCGELDENLLLDTLFGHIKGAFTEARTDRKGAFLEADGGTLFLDEIQSASSKVQQALLRCVAMRVIKPLGSDREVPVNVRLIAASNVSLKDMVEQGRFRSDVYYRLRVLMICTPALRTHRENIPRLARHFMDQAEVLAGRPHTDLSRGAIERLLEYDWPGNVRELQNCMTMTVTMCDKMVIQASDLLLEGASPNRVENALGVLPTLPNTVVPPAEAVIAAMDKAWQTENPSSATATDPASSLPEEVPATGPAQTPTPNPAPAAAPPAPEVPSAIPPDMNARQTAAWPQIVAEKEITRARYEELAGADVSSRTAVNDLQDLVDRKLLRKIGRGPATRYVVVERARG